MSRAPFRSARFSAYGLRLTAHYSGYTLIALVIGIAILTILVAAVAPSLGTIMKREREEELIFRGRQYARALGLFQRRYGRYPNQLKELYENRPRSIRKLWKDPMCDCNWHVLIQGTPDAVPGSPRGSPAPPGAPQFGAPTPGPRGPGSRLTPTPSGLFGGGGGDQPVGPIVGVRSTIHKEGLKEWRGRKYYDEWRFIVGDADRDTLPGAGLPPGAPQFGPPTPPPRR